MNILRITFIFSILFLGFLQNFASFDDSANNSASKFVESINSFETAVSCVLVYRGQWGSGSWLVAGQPYALSQEVDARKRLWGFLQNSNPIDSLKALEDAKEESKRITEADQTTYKDAWQKLPPAIQKLTGNTNAGLRLSCREKFILYNMIYDAARNCKKNAIEGHIHAHETLQKWPRLKESLLGGIYFWWKGYALAPSF